MKSIIVDVDGTVCEAINRDYENAVPIQPVIDKINYLYKHGYTITLYTSRGMNSCHGDIARILEKNEGTLKNWLHKNGVLYHKLIFGKPLGDWYVDDRSLSVSDFVKMPFVELKGGSGESVRREGDLVLKTGKSSKMQYDWYKKVNSSGSCAALHIPEVYGFTVDTVYMKYVSGIPANQTPENFSSIVKFIEQVSKIECDTHFNLNKYCNNILSHINEPWTNEVCEKILSLEEELHRHVSFCHGDPTLANCIVTEEKFFMIDPVYKEDFNSYLVDFSKLRMSLNGFEENLNMHTDSLKKSYEFALSSFDQYLNRRKILSLVKLLEIANWIRLHNFRKGEEQEFAYHKAKSLWERYEK